MTKIESGPRAAPSDDPARPALPALALRASEDRFRLLVDSVVDYGIFILSPQGYVTSWNAGAARMNGYSASEIIGKHFSTFYPPEDVASGKCERELVTAEQEGRFEEEGWRVRKDGTRFWANVVITALREGGALVGFGKVTRDLTERQTSLTALQRSEERLRLLIASVSDYAIFMLDPSGNVATWNLGAERLKGYRAEEIIGQHFSVFYPEIDVDAGKCEMELEGATHSGRFEDEGWRIRKDGTPFWANVVITAVRDARGEVLGFAKITRDLSERKRHEEERIVLARSEEARRVAELNEERSRALAEDLRLARDKAEQATRLKDEFLATVSHELRTPLNAILGWGRMLHSGVLSPEKQAHAIETIVRNTTAQVQIIDDLLDVSRIINGQLRLHFEMVDVNQLVASAIEVVRPSADAKDISLHWRLEPSAGLVNADSGRLQQVLWNLLNNAVKFTPKGGSVRVSLERPDDFVRLTVADTGKGISPEFLPRVFERFAQQDANQARKFGGLGLGLAIVKHLVELHGGTVTVQSEGEGLGATFVLRLPSAARTSAQSGVAASPQPLTDYDELSRPPELENLKVLVIDDEVDARELVQAVLERCKSVVTVVPSVAAALDSIAQQPPDVIISDIAMPGEDGYSFIRKLRALPREQGGRIPAVALTAFARAEDRRMALTAGFQNHAAKPIEPQELMMVVANLVGRYS
ncbi:MAG TPA: PAS domain S-box protein [Polyangiaceae bacterium]|nr:PAS domain S-box protein [Polyangiaceae bacterium]